MAASLEQNSTLTSFSLLEEIGFVSPGMKINAKGNAALERTLQRNSTLRALSLTSKSYEDDGACFSALQVNTALTRLDLYALSDPKDVIPLLIALMTNSTLKSLNLGDTRLNGRSLAALARVLAVNTSLEILSVGMVQHGLADYFASSLERNFTLKSITLKGESSACANVIAAATKNNVVDKMSFPGVIWNDNHVHVLSDVITRNTALRKLDLSDNRFSPTSRRSLFAALRRNSTLTSIKIETRVKTEAAAIVEAICSRNKSRGSAVVRGLTAKDLLPRDSWK
eukprot:TRINITY_DN4380_c0_g1_i1.p1 TRINITY_DN4380_c0_g1~~TRINITY_DN4380_c0_g1_i1.p1  ORF type:complete len:283 (-),score=11.61 TRINITY_DN4380_c0_g1_i1:46-894(-)